MVSKYRIQYLCSKILICFRWNLLWIFLYKLLIIDQAFFLCFINRRDRKYLSEEIFRIKGENDPKGGYLSPQKFTNNV